MRNRKLTAIAAFFFAIAVSRLVMSPSIADVRSVDIATIFVAGFAAGAVFVSLIRQKRAPQT